jgi:hypothetical protein
LLVISADLFEKRVHLMAGWAVFCSQAGSAEGFAAPMSPSPEA